ncbi:MAG: 5'-methylthioadenosine/S-adenosylhomocysteine nucleosidase [Epulopiscium sp. Nuni2H_MBin001]|nr:MAG: 5'-methylthioadenosine/S-adenosylhomocysteine nucleosidase [Epulopiscium sp. Nuni2H_MBin001]
MIGIIGAMEEEVIAIKRCMKINTTKTKAQMEFCLGTFKDKDVVVVRCGIGKVNAAICTQVLIDDFGVNTIINTGVAGGLYPEINIGDVVISSDTVQHDMDTTVFGDKKGFIPRLNKAFFEADERLINIAKTAAEEVIAPYKVYVGRIASGDQFVSSMQVREEIYTTFTAYCAEMEGAAIAHTCYLNELPFVIIRAISDKADHSASMNFEDFTELAARNATKILEKMVEAIRQ